MQLCLCMDQNPIKQAWNRHEWKESARSVQVRKFLLLSQRIFMWPFFKDIRISPSKDDENPDRADRDVRRATSMLGQCFLPPPHSRAAANKNVVKHCLCVCACIRVPVSVYLYLLHTEYHDIHGTSKVRTFLQSEVILAGPRKFKSCLRVKTFKLQLGLD